MRDTYTCYFERNNPIGFVAYVPSQLYSDLWHTIWSVYSVLFRVVGATEWKLKVRTTQVFSLN